MKNILSYSFRFSFLRTICVCTALLFLMNACNKNDSTASSAHLPAGSVSINAATDTLGFDIPIGKDSAITLRFSARAKEKFSGMHTVTFQVDSAKIKDYISKYGAASVLPSASYYLYKTNVQLSPDSLISTAVQINTISETKLTPLTTYILPVTITEIDGSASAIDTSDNTVYLIVRTGKSPLINKSNWSIVDYSSAYFYPAVTNYAPHNLIDNNLNTPWASNLGSPMPQYVTIDMAQTYPVNGITYWSYGSLGTIGYPTEVNIQLSTDAQNWTDKGNFTDATTVPGASRTFNFGTTNARYIKFTVVASIPYTAAGTSTSWAFVAELSALQQVD